MSIWNKILLGLIFVAALGFFHAATRTLYMYTYWAQSAGKFESKLIKLNEENKRLQTADRAHPLDNKTIGVQQLRIDLGRMMTDRGRVWAQWDKKKVVTLPSGITDVTVSTQGAVPSAFTKNMLVYAFEEGDEKSAGKYLGEFRVDAVSSDQIVLASTTQMVSSLAKNVADSKGPWVLYEMMPIDEHEVFASVPEDQKSTYPDEFLKDGQVDGSGKKVERPLRDYLAIFRACEVYRTLFADRLESTRRDVTYLENASQEVESQAALLDKEKTNVLNEKQRAVKELNAVTGLYAAVQRMLSFNQVAVQEAIARNLKDAQDIAKRQKEAADLIDRRTRSMAQYGPGAN
jgi:hypothetical protein